MSDNTQTQGDGPAIHTDGELKLVYLNGGWVCGKIRVEPGFRAIFTNIVLLSDAQIEGDYEIGKGCVDYRSSG